jgi:hypothetical protein
LETCVRHQANLLITAGSSPVLRTQGGIRDLLAPPVVSERLGQLAEEIRLKGGSRISFPGLQIVLIHYAQYNFRIALVGQSNAYAILVTRYPEDPKSLEAIQQEWNDLPSDKETWVKTLTWNLTQSTADIVPFDGSPLAAWEGDGLRFLARTTLSNSDIKSYVDEITTPSQRLRQPGGYTKFAFTVGRKRIHAAFFDESTSYILLLMQSSDQRETSSNLASKSDQRRRTQLKVT